MKLALDQRINPVFDRVQGKHQIWRQEALTDFMASYTSHHECLDGQAVSGCGFRHYPPDQ
ncbi:MAG: hypothetical protein JAY99_14025 [Candidatus Thiodiazotropha lotti]|nr:hypothetical protein [Candidatus Thiodiazotropha lotti]MCG8000637.1 hypothetical protein [Candidatus Thiodiazotropha lotti]MCW4181685.1 hypothetical protein [Candidatus Thiodiazotropha weberae]MCW4192408.1 hypothetical protein [Candidatus Thiodiazotropha weberae]